jgi:hypothetical protein
VIVNPPPTSTARAHARTRFDRLADALIVALIFTTGLVLGRWTFDEFRAQRTMETAPGFNQRVFSAAVMQTCGRGQIVPTVTAGVIVEFVSSRRSAMACADVPRGITTEPLDALQSASRYLILIVAATWWITGPSWPALSLLVGALAGVTVATAYIVCRLTMGRVPSAAVALLVAISPLHLSNVLDIRDYSKAPFFMAALLACGLLVTAPLNARVVAAIAVAAGALVGFGFGVRTDIALNLLPVVATLLLFRSAAGPRQWGTGAIAAALCVAAFLATAWPIISARAGGGNVWHWALLGLGQDFDAALGVGPTPYRLGFVYSDSYVATDVDAFAGRVLGSRHALVLNSAAYEQASREYFLTVARIFPADLLARGWAAVLAILNLPFSDARIGGALSGLPFPDVPGMLRRILTWRARLFTAVDGIGPLLFAAVAVAISAASIRGAVFLFALVAFFGAYPAIQFQRRHVFHLEFLALWIVAFALTACTRLIWSHRHALGAFLRTLVPSSVQVRRMSVFTAAAVVAITVPVAALRAVQQRRAGDLLAEYEAAPRASVPFDPKPAGEGVVRLGAAVLRRPAPREARSTFSEMVVARVASAGCHYDALSLTFRYAAKTQESDFTRTLTVPVPRDRDRYVDVFMPALYTGGGNPQPDLLALAGVDVPDDQQACVQSLSRFQNPDAFPLLLEAVLPAEWQQLTRHQTIRAFEDPVVYSGRPMTYWFPPASVRSRPAIDASVAAVDGFRFGMPKYLSRIARLRDGVLTISGRADTPGSNIAEWKPLPMSRRQLLFASGTLVRGGLTIALAGEHGSAARVDITAAGDFRAIIRPPDDDAYEVTIANHLSGGLRRNQAVIDRFAIVDPGVR